jgi:serine/threonine protein kinase
MQLRGNTTMIEGAGPGGGEAGYRVRHARLADAGRFVSLLAEGGMGAALLAEDVSGAPKGFAVLKVLREDRVRDEASGVRFARELQTHEKVWQRFQAPRLVPCLRTRLAADPALVFCVLPYYPDGTLQAVVDSGASLLDALRVLADAVEGLQALHGHGFVHRDVCPTNIFVVREAGRRRGVLGDLGVAVPLGGDTTFSPEQAEADLRLRVGHVGFIAPAGTDPIAADLFSVGAVLCWLVAGASPALPVDTGRMALPPIERCRPGVRAELRAAAAEVIDRLTLPGQPASISTASQAREAILDLAERSLPVAADESTTEVGRRAWRRTTLIAGAAVILVVVSFGALAWLRGPKAPAARVPPAPAPAATTPQESLLPAARVLIADGKRDEAEVLLRREVAANPSNADATALLAGLLCRKGRDGLHEAQSVLAAFVARQPSHGEMRLMLARLLVQLGSTDDAITLLKAAPDRTTHAGEIDRMVVTLERLAHQK